MKIRSFACFAIVGLMTLGTAFPAFSSPEMEDRNSSATDHMEMNGEGGSHDSIAHQGGESEFIKANHVAMKKMQHDMMSASMNGNPDHDFAAMMIPHHQGAIDMAEIELKYGADPDLRKLAEKIIAAQKLEISEMKSKLVELDKAKTSSR